MEEASAPVQIIHRGKLKPVDTKQRRWLKRRQVIEPVIGHTKTDHRMDRCWLGGSRCEELHGPRIGTVLRRALRVVAQRDGQLESRRYRLVPIVPAGCT